MADFETSYSVVNRVLVIEDEADERDRLRDLLEKDGLTVETVKDGGQSRGAFNMNKPDLVLLDLVLPNESGYEVCEWIKEQDETVPVVIHSAISMEDSVKLAERVGADAYLVKPADDGDILTTIRNTAEEVWRRNHLDGPSDSGGKVRFECTHCHSKIKVLAKHRGHQLSCPKCGTRVVVPRA